MNTKSIQLTLTKSYPKLPILSSHKQSKIVTKHFTNAALYLPRKQFVLLSWLIFQSGVDNTFKHSTHLLSQFSAYIIEIELEYRGDSIPTAIQLIRKDLKELIELGYVFQVTGKTLMINPMLVYSKRVSKEDIELAAKLYQSRDIKGIIEILSKY